MKKQLICAECGSVGDAKRAVKGNLAVEILLWCFFLVPGFIYSIWRQGTYHKACAVCGSTNLIPVDSPVGQKLFKEHGGTANQLQEENMPAGSWSLKKKVLIGVGALFGISFLIVQIGSIGR